MIFGWRADIMAKKAMEAQKKQSEAMARHALYMHQRAVMASGEAAAGHFANQLNQLASCRNEKCACCGSREFRGHNGRSVCAYCRSMAT